MLQAIGEGVDLLEHFRQRLDIAPILSCWRHGSVIRAPSRSISQKLAAYRSERGLSQIPPFMEDTGEVNWLVDDALRMARSRDLPNPWCSFSPLATSEKTGPGPLLMVLGFWSLGGEPAGASGNDGVLGAAMGHRARGLLRDGDCWDYLPARPRPQPRLPLGRRRAAGHHRSRMPPLLRARALERERPDPQGAAVRPDGPGGQPRRGRQGALLLPRRHADPLVHEGALQVPAARVSLRAARRGEPPPRQDDASSRADRHRASSTTTATSTCSSSTRRPPRRHPDPDHGRQPRARGRRCTCCRRSGFATPGRGADREGCWPNRTSSRDGKAS